MARLDPELLVHHEGVLYARDDGAASHLSTRRRNHEGDHEPTGDRKTDALHARRLRGAVAGLGSGPMPVTPASLRRSAPNRADGRPSLFLDRRYGVSSRPHSTRRRRPVSEDARRAGFQRSEEHTSEIKSLMRTSYA